MVSHMDRDVGKIMSLLKDLELEDNTLVIFTSDNGPTYDRLGGSDSEFFLSAGPFRGLKGSLYEGGIRVPFVTRWPGHISAGSVTDHISAFWDIFPTLCEITGTKPPTDTDGISFVSTLLGQGKQTDHEYLYWEFPSYGGQQALRMGDWKGVRQNIFKDSMQIELYNLSTDIGEKRDVSNEYPQKVKQIETLMKKARVPSELFGIEQLDTRN
jgi:arylsulfatase A